MQALRHHSTDGASPGGLLSVCFRSSNMRIPWGCLRSTKHPRYTRPLVGVAGGTDGGKGGGLGGGGDGETPRFGTILHAVFRQSPPHEPSGV